MLTLKAKGESIKELFINSLEGMNRILNKHYEKELNSHNLTREIDLWSSDKTTLLADFLSEILTISQHDKVLFYNVDLLEIKDNSLHAHVIGTKITHFKKDIKGVDYHEADVRINKKGAFETKIVFDA